MVGGEGIEIEREEEDRGVCGGKKKTTTSTCGCFPTPQLNILILFYFFKRLFIYEGTRRMKEDNEEMSRSSLVVLCFR